MSPGPALRAAFSSVQEAPPRGRARRARAGAGLMLAAAVMAGCTPAGPDPPTSGAAGRAGTTPAAPTMRGSAPVDAAAARASLERVPVKGRAPKTGYSRERFGPAWADVDGDGCDTRNQLLGDRELTRVRFQPGTGGCVVLEGDLADPYVPRAIRYRRGGDYANAVDLDHVVALGDAWAKGAQQLSATQRTRFANDPLNLRAVDPSANRSKGDSDAASWLPRNRAFRCEYVATQIAVKVKYRLWVTRAERDAMRRVLGGCVRSGRG